MFQIIKISNHIIIVSIVTLSHHNNNHELKWKSPSSKQELTTFTLITALIRVWQAKLHHATNCWFFSVCPRTFVACVVSVQPSPATLCSDRQLQIQPSACLQIQASQLGHRCHNGNNTQATAVSESTESLVSFGSSCNVWVGVVVLEYNTSFLNLTGVSFAYISKRLSYNASGIASRARRLKINE